MPACAADTSKQPFDSGAELRVMATLSPKRPVRNSSRSLACLSYPHPPQYSTCTRRSGSSVATVTIRSKSERAPIIRTSDLERVFEIPRRFSADPELTASKGNSWRAIEIPGERDLPRFVWESVTRTDWMAAREYFSCIPLT